MTGTPGGKGKEHIYGVNDLSYSEYWTQSASAASEEDLDFCIMENCGSFLTDDQFENIEVFLLNHKIENSEEVLMAGKIDHSEKIAIDEPTWAELDKVKNSQSYARDATEFEDLVEWTKLRTKSRNLGWRHRQWQHQQGQQNQERVAATNTSFKRRVHRSMLMKRVIKQRHQCVSLMTPTEANGSRKTLWLTVEQSNA